MAYEQSNEDGPLYPKQPLVEVATEVNFRGILAIETARADFQEKISSEYPNLFVPYAKDGIAPALQRVRFENEAGNFGVQLAINSFSFYSRQYPGSAIFIAEAKRLFEIIEPILKPLRLTRIGWRYINVIPYVRENGNVPLLRFFSTDTFLGTGVNSEYDKVFINVETRKKDMHTRLRLFSSSSENEPERESIILDTDTYIGEGGMSILDRSDAVAMISEAHDGGRDTFESIITGEYREYIKGADNE